MAGTKTKIKIGGLVVPTLTTTTAIALWSLLLCVLCSTFFSVEGTFLWYNRYYSALRFQGMSIHPPVGGWKGRTTISISSYAYPWWVRSNYTCYNLVPNMVTMCFFWEARVRFANNEELCCVVTDVVSHLYDPHKQYNLHHEQYSNLNSTGKNSSSGNCGGTENRESSKLSGNENSRIIFESESESVGGSNSGLNNKTVGANIDIRINLSQANVTKTDGGNSRTPRPNSNSNSSHREVEDEVLNQDFKINNRTLNLDTKSSGTGAAAVPAKATAINPVQKPLTPSLPTQVVAPGNTNFSAIDSSAAFSASTSTGKPLATKEATKVSVSSVSSVNANSANSIGDRPAEPKSVEVTVFAYNNFADPSENMQVFEKCTTLPISWHYRISSINTHGGCVEVYQYKNCVGRCLRVAPGTLGHNRLRDVNFDKRITSIKICPPDQHQSHSQTKERTS